MVESNSNYPGFGEMSCEERLIGHGLFLGRGGTRGVPTER